MNIITKKSGTEKTFIGISGGTFFQNSEIFSHNRPTEWGRISVSGGHSGTNGYRQHQQSDSANASLAGTIDISNTMTLDLNVAFVKTDMQFPGSLTTEQFDDDPSKVNPSSFALGGFEYYITGGAAWTWTPEAGFSILAPLSYKWRNVQTDSSYYYYENKQNNIEFRPQIFKTINFGNGMSLRPLAGVDLYYAGLDITSYTDQTRTDKLSLYNVGELTLAPYFTLRFDPIKSLSLSAGVREDIAFINIDQNMDQGEPVSSSDKKDYSAFIEEVGITFNPIDIFKIYAKYSSLFRYPFTDELTKYTMEGMKFNKDLKPEEGFNVEGGIGLYFGIAELNANLFYMKLNNEIVYNEALYLNENLDATERLGTNINLTAHILEYADINAAYSFVKANFADGDNKDKIIPLVPEHTFYASVMAKIPALGISFGPDFNFRSSFYRGGDTANALDQIDGYFLLGAKARFALKKDGKEYSIQLTMRNLTDTKYATQVYYSSYSGTAYYPDADMGRSLNLTLQFRY
ncbi:MAG: TonB-dependent receptor [Spirochaetaceae bacterium]|nr:TonB-dependent receptor [Spirochaetaceae bacterium]